MKRLRYIHFQEIFSNLRIQIPAPKPKFVKATFEDQIKKKARTKEDEKHNRSQKNDQGQVDILPLQVD